MVFRELSFSRLECGVHDRLHIYPLCGIFDFPWHRHQIQVIKTTAFSVSSERHRDSHSNVESQVFTPNNSRLLARGSNLGRPRDKLASYHWTTAPHCKSIQPKLFKRLFELCIPLSLFTNHFHCVQKCCF